MSQVNLAQELLRCGVVGIVGTVANRKTHIPAEGAADKGSARCFSGWKVDSSVAGYCVFFPREVRNLDF